MIHSMGFGEIDKMSHESLLYTVDAENTQAPVFPLMWSFTQSNILTAASVTSSIYIKTYTIAVIDKLTADERNVEEIFSDTERICLDIISILQDEIYYPYFSVNKQATLNQITGFNESDDGAVGYSFDVQFRMPFDVTRCDAPSAIPTPLPQS